MDDKHHPEPFPSSFYQSRGPGDEKLQTRWQRTPILVRDRNLRRLCIAICIILATWTLTRSLLPYIVQSHSARDQQDRIIQDELLQPTNKNTTRKVSLEAHVMSKCPDAKACLHELVVPAMEKVNDKVDFELSFIGRVDPNSDAVSCMHGPSECLGNMILLCAAQLYPDPKLSLGFANCLIGDYHDIPARDLVESCAMEHSLDFKKINSCISEEGKAQAMLRDSVERSADAKVKTSCTIRLQGKEWCVTDGKTDCNDGDNLDGLVKDITSKYEELNS